jgi:predicted XRE-type DNA-binding protein
MAKQKITPSPGNVFSDLKLPDAAELHTKARLGATLCRIVEQKRLSQAEIAATLGISQPKVSALLHYKLEGYSVERLMRFLVALNPATETRNCAKRARLDG